jgi:Family of unknown function (DUF6069)
MSTTTSTALTAQAAIATTGPVSGSSRRAIVLPGVLASAAAAAATTGAAAIAAAAGVTFAARTGEPIPILGFTQVTLVCALVGVGLAAVLARRAKRPRATFVRITAALVVLSFVPDVVSGFNATATVTLMLLHVLAAAIVVPTLAVRLALLRQPKQHG